MISVPLVYLLSAGDVKEEKKKIVFFFLKVNLNSKWSLNSRFFFSIVWFKWLGLLHVRSVYI